MGHLHMDGSGPQDRVNPGLLSLRGRRNVLWDVLVAAGDHCGMLRGVNVKLPTPRAGKTVSSTASATTEMNTLARPAIDTAAATAPKLLEQLMQIARTSALEELASGIAHELNQSIGAIATFAQTGERMLARPAPLVSEAREVLHHIGGEALKAGKGIHRVRELFERSTAPRSKSDLSTVVAEVLPLLEALAQRYGVELQSTLQPQLPLVAIDRLRIQHVLFTLVQNALESPTSQADPVVSLEVKGDRYAVITTITDEGAGISAEVRERLFRPFFTTKDHGTGLGLASSRAIIEAHEGTIGFDAAERGARFWFRLPAATAEDEDGDAHQG